MTNYFEKLGIAEELVQRHLNRQATTLIPGDWVFIANTDLKTQHKTGYEGSNAIYLGRGKFDYYNDHHSYTFREKLNEVY